MSGSAGKRRIAEEQGYPAQIDGSVNLSSPLAVIAICSGLIVTLGVTLLVVQVRKLFW